MSDDPVRTAAEALVKCWDDSYRPLAYSPDWPAMEALRAALAAEQKRVEIADEMAARAAEAAWQAWPYDIAEPSWSALQIAVRAALRAALSSEAQKNQP